ncbi:tetratricopeptide repeat protein [bacterium]|nr:tetratricopeptide repeat protein [bacterium]
MQPNFGKAYNNLGAALNEQGKLNEAIAEYRKAISVQPNHGRAYYNLVEALIKHGKLDEAIDYYEIHRKVVGPEHPRTLWLMHTLSSSYYHAGRHEEALAMREEVLRLRRKVLGPEHLDTLNAMHTLSFSYYRAGRHKEAFAMLEEALELDRKVVGPEHFETLGVMHNLSYFYNQAGRHKEAVAMQEELLELRRKVLGPEHPDTLNTMDELANSYHKAGRREEALAMKEEVLKLCRKVFGSEDWRTRTVMKTLVGFYNKLGFEYVRDSKATKEDVAEGVKLAQRACELAPKEPNNWNTLSLALYRNGEWKKALEALKTGTKLNPDISHSWLLLAMTHWQLDDKDEARKWYDKALAWREKNKPEKELQGFFTEAEKLMGKGAADKETPDKKESK